ncbi:cytochrome c oxidase subunit III [Parahaliea maris]|uniref:Cytochrome c oxidase subunit III n=1 Tax=Parahaliea maris TaxID=2716870 RepID=A0A5C8ZZN9_9GAMM|nr:cytochrome c oxidase subunit 3 [Parahaliea maris]TXS94073.1 cytochrome c oxidase subunit III [Parahaliea maris]
MSLFSTLREKPWEPQPQPAVPGPAVAADPMSTARTALRFIMAIVSVLFFLFIITFLSRSQYPDFQALAGQPWQPFTDTSRLWFNTALLGGSSLAMHWAVMSARREQLNHAVLGVSLGVFFAIAFLLAQLDLWQRLSALGYYVNSNPANSYFYLLTAVHGLHLLGGMVVLANILFRVWYDDSLASLSGPLSLCAQYWHFLLAVWLVLFALLASSPGTINALAALCGF